MKANTNCLEKMIEKAKERSIDGDIVLSDKTLYWYDKIQDREMEICLEKRDEDDFIDKIVEINQASKKCHVSGEEIASLLASIDPAMTCSLDKIYIYNRRDGDEALAEAANVSLDQLPEMIGDRDCMGCFWSQENSIILDISAIEEAGMKGFNEMCDWGYPSEPEVQIRLAFFTTLTHEIGHLGFENPLVSECMGFWHDDFDKEKFEAALEDMKSESGVEKWGIEAYENWEYLLWQKEKEKNGMKF